MAPEPARRPVRRAFSFLKELEAEWSRDNVGDVAAALTFFGVLALFPFLLFVVSLASLVIDPAAAESMVNQLSRVAPDAVVQIVGGRLRSLAESDQTGLATLSAVGAIWAASGAIAALIRALNRAYGVQDGRPFWKVRLLAIGMTLLGAVLSLVAASITVATPALAESLGPVGPVLMWLRFPVAALAMMLLLAVLYWALPDVEQEFRFITPGSVVAVVIWLAASWGFSVYVKNFGKYEVTYGALGGVVILLFWMWISSQAVLLGAEINALVERRRPPGERRGARSPATRGTGPARVAPAARPGGTEPVRKAPPAPPLPPEPPPTARH